VWGDANPARICVLAPYAPQVREIRRLLRSKSLGGVQVEFHGRIEPLFNEVHGQGLDLRWNSTLEHVQHDGHE